MNSMTGYGRGDASGAGVSITVELKSVNNRFRDIQLRCPREYAALEPRINNVLKDRFSRGRLDVYVRRVSLEGSVEVTADKTLARVYIQAIRDLVHGIDGIATELPLATIVGLPGVLVTGEAQVDATAEWLIVEAAMEAAINHLSEMRAQEGEALRQDLLQNLNQFQADRQKVQLESVGVSARLQVRLLDRINKLIGERVDPIRIAQEVAVQADKADVSEELARLASHVRQFETALEADEPVGRRLDFLIQEMNREVNTIGSKTVDHAISSLVVDMKSVLERLKEQVANVE